MDAIDIQTVKALLLDGGTRGPDGVDRLVSAFDEMNTDARRVFVDALSHAIQNILSDTHLAENRRDLAFDNSAHLVQHVLEKSTDAAFFSDLREPCLAWLATGRSDHSLWYAYGCVLRLTRFTGYVDKSFWKDQFDFWLPQLIEKPERFVEVCRAIMQCVRALGREGNLDSTHLGSLFANGLRATNFPVHEVYAALEEITTVEGLPSEVTSRRLYDVVQRDIDDASSLDSAPQPIQTNSRNQLNLTLRSWRVNKLLLPPREMVSTDVAPRRPLRCTTY